MAKRNGTCGYCKPTAVGRTSHPTMGGLTGTVTQRKGGATWRDIGWLFYKASRGGAQKPMNMAKPSEVIQRETKSPSEFYQRLCEACRLYTPIDPEADGSQTVITAVFVSQAYPENVRWGNTK